MINQKTLEQAREGIALMWGLSTHIREGFQQGLSQQARIARMGEVYGRIEIGLFPVVTWLERNRSMEFAKLMKHRLGDVLGCAQYIVTCEIPEYAPGMPDVQPGSQRSAGCEENSILVMHSRMVAQSFDEVLAEICTQQELLSQQHSTLLAQERAATAASSSPSNSQTKKVPAKRGRKPDTDAEEDAKVAAAWDTGQHKTLAELARLLEGHDEKSVRKAKDRHRKR
ncbi:MAG: hypothetical protein ACKVS9_10800 [Phycisphaerae bacterium]